MFANTAWTGLGHGSVCVNSYTERVVFPLHTHTQSLLPVAYTLRPFKLNTTLLTHKLQYKQACVGCIMGRGKLYQGEVVLI